MRNFIRFSTLALATIIFIVLSQFSSITPLKNFILKNKLSRPKVGEIAFSLENSNSSQGIEQVNVMFKSGDGELVYEISSFSFRFIYAVKNESDFVVLDPEGRSVNEITPNKIIANASGWTICVNEVKREENRVVVDFAAVYKGHSGFSASDYVTVASIYLNKGSFEEKDLEKLELERSHSAMYTKEKPVANILKREAKVL